jgi:hypothetical protein
MTIAGHAKALALSFDSSAQKFGAGYATSAAAFDTPGYRIQQHTRHKSAEMVNRYIRKADKWTNGGLKGVGF